MARKIYMKFSDERNPENAIRTVICDKNGIRTVTKEPVFEEGASHIKDMHIKTSLLEQAFPSIKLPNAEIKGTVWQCDYIEGVSLAELYIGCIYEKNREELFRIIAKHVDLIKGNEDNQCLFCESNESKRIFGDLSRFHGKKALKITNFEATANNIYLSPQDIYFIDYEWIFDFTLPLDLILYHCIVWTGYNNIPQLADVISEKELMVYLQLEDDLCQNHDNFIRYINFITGNCAYYLVKQGYTKGQYSIYDIEQIWMSKMAQQQRHIDNLENGMKGQQQHIDNLENGIKGQRQHIDNLENEMKKQQRYMNNLEDEINRKQEYIAGLEKDGERKQERIQNLNEISNEQQTRITYLEGTLAVQNEYTVNLENKLDRYIDKQRKN